MTLRADTGAVLLAMGFSPNEFNVTQPTPTSAEIQWFSQQAQPTEATINAYDLPTGQLQALYTKAKALLIADDPISKKDKAFVLVALDTFNRHSRQFRDLLAAIAAATSLANLQTRCAAIAPVEPERTIADLKTSISGKIDTGQADG